MRFEFLPHTADIKIKVYGKNFDEIINNSLLALKSFLKPKLSKQKITKDIEVSNKNEAELLIDFLSEVLAQTYIEKAIFIKVKARIEQNQNFFKLKAKITGYKFFKIFKDIKAITYHQVKLEKTKKFLIFEFIMDI
jgi:SHS2 domain-containing protein